jgi:hypothetical protein
MTPPEGSKHARLDRDAYPSRRGPIRGRRRHASPAAVHDRHRPRGGRRPHRPHLPGRDRLHAAGGSHPAAVRALGPRGHGVPDPAGGAADRVPELLPRRHPRRRPPAGVPAFRLRSPGRGRGRAGRDRARSAVPAPDAGGGGLSPHRAAARPGVFRPRRRRALGEVAPRARAALLAGQGLRRAPSPLPPAGGAAGRAGRAHDLRLLRAGRADAPAHRGIGAGRPGAQRAAHARGSARGHAGADAGLPRLHAPSAPTSRRRSGWRCGSCR